VSRIHVSVESAMLPWRRRLQSDAMRVIRTSARLFSFRLADECPRLFRNTLPAPIPACPAPVVYANWPGLYPIPRIGIRSEAPMSVLFAVLFSLVLRGLGSFWQKENTLTISRLVSGFSVTAIAASPLPAPCRVPQGTGIRCLAPARALVVE
jgi:hypothetical protein